jgi:hypothetical protein
MEWYYSERYNIDNEPISIVTCANCGTQIEANPEDLLLFDMKQTCCEYPDYFWSVRA